MEQSKTIYILIIVLLSMSFTCAAGGKLKSGKWNGYYMDHNGSKYKLKYTVHYDNELAENKLKIEMINLDMQPKGRYQLQDIEVHDKTLSFKIKHTFDIKSCVLSKDDNCEYAGICQSNVAENDESSHISMIPVSTPALE